MMDGSVSCSDVEALLDGWMDGTLDAAERARVQSHLDGCAQCAALAGDLAALRAQARALPDLEAPAARMWEGIARRIEARVVTLSPTPARPNGRWRGWQLPAAAAALVLLTAGVTSVATMHWMDGQRATRTIGGVETGGSATFAPAAATAAEAQIARRASATYDQEIARLRAILAARRSDLDSATVAVIEHNLAVIDTAIQQSSEALARDPGSTLLLDQWNDARDKQLELLRTAAALPRRS
ncbi:MAG TPA: zf-HC2 domain-containing protein [Gemmatimonadaceae bacterium]|nr:zf-HC2 domain-containing protein [Gemmatimonadaceae bacterium]